MARVFLATPSYSEEIHHFYYESLKQVTSSSEHIIEEFKVYGTSVEHAKQMLYKKFLETSCDYFFNVDSDIIFMDIKENPIDKLISSGKSIIGGIYVYRRNPSQPTHRTLELQEIYEKEGKMPENYRFKIPNKIHEVKWLSGGCMMIKREVIEKLMRKYPVPNLPIIYKKEYLSEDFAFCQRARKEGYKIYAEPTIKLGHLGEKIYTLSDYR